jgi:hypothetical protein
MEKRFGRQVVLALRVALLTALLSAATPARAEADLWCWLFNSGCGGSSSTSSARDVPSREAPEIDPNALAGAFALAAGGAAMLGDRLRRRR